jgi:hypothetical protein
MPHTRAADRRRRGGKLDPTAVLVRNPIGPILSSYFPHSTEPISRQGAVSLLEGEPLHLMDEALEPPVVPNPLLAELSLLL